MELALKKEDLRKKRIDSIQELILQLRQVHYSDINEIEGPTVELFYHEIKPVAPGIIRTLDIVIGSILYLLYLLIMPVICLILKLTGVKKCFYRFNAVGRHGKKIETTIFNVERKQTSYCSKYGDGKANMFQKFLIHSGLFKLPQLKNVFDGTASLVGPEMLEEKFAEQVINKYSDSHKRFAAKPGVFSPSCYYFSPASQKKEKYRLCKDLYFSCEQTIGNYFKILLLRKYTPA